jgi:hypothetical protein
MGITLQKLSVGKLRLWKDNIEISLTEVRYAEKWMESPLVKFSAFFSPRLPLIEICLIRIYGLFTCPSFGILKKNN